MNNDNQNESPDNIQLPNSVISWFLKRYPDVYRKYVRPIDLATTAGGVYYVKDISEDFLADTIGILGNPKSPTVHLGAEKSFFRYDPNAGIYMPISDNKLVSEFSQLLNKCAVDCNEPNKCNTTSLVQSLSRAGKLQGTVTKAMGLLSVDDNFFNSNIEDYIACSNGMLRLSDMVLLPFSPEYRRRNKLSVAYDPDAKCSLFIDTLMRQALDDDDIAFLQKWFGMALLGKNMAQIILILSGTAQGGKSTFVNVVAGVIGKENIATLRTEQLNQRFELASFLGKTLLHGADVPADFLTQKSASILKSLTGGDSVTVELKNARERPEIVGAFNVIIVSNSRLVIRLEGDAAAWQRRLAIIEYRKPKPQHIITSLADMILKDEGPGVLNWALAGLIQLRLDKWHFKMTESQEKTRDRTLLESDSPQQFVLNCIEIDENATLTQEDCFGKYVEYCKRINWTPLPRPTANAIIENQIMRNFAVGQRNDIKGSSGTAQRGWKGLRVKI